MAFTTLLASPNRLILLQDAVGSGTTTITQAALIAACAAGPLKAALTNAVTASQWGNLEGNPNGKATIAIRARSYATDLVTFGVDLGTNTLRIKISGAGAIVVEIAFLHSLTK